MFRRDPDDPRPGQDKIVYFVAEPLKRLIMQKRDGGELKQAAIAEDMLLYERAAGAGFWKATPRSKTSSG